MPTYKTPDVYVEEISVFPPSVAEVETAVPAFIGYTQKARRTSDGDLALKPTKIFSLKEYEDLFGYAFSENITVTVNENPDTGELLVGGFTVGGETPDDTTLPTYLLYFAVKMYFDNGGGQCYVVSVGTYGDGEIDGAELGKGLDALALEDEPTLIVIPEAAKLEFEGYQTLAQAVLAQCGKLGDRFGIFDAFNGNQGQNLPSAVEISDVVLTNVEAARQAFGTKDLKYGAVYYPFVRTTLNYAADEDSTVTVILPPEVEDEADEPAPPPPPPAEPEEPADEEEEDEPAPEEEEEDDEPAPPPPPPPPAEEEEEEAEDDEDAGVALGSLKTTDTQIYNFVKAALKDRYMIMPPSGAVAGVYAYTDTTRGVWKAPANVSLADVLEPVIRLDNTLQDPLNVDATSGKSINAIRAFSGKGTLVWGARTLAGNDNEWRYVSVRRFFNMVEESIKKSTYWAVFEPNDANTWVKVRGMIENYLTQKWREGALAGATPKDAFFVRCGLGTTMSSVDILEGRMNVEIGMAVVRPAEFIILKFSHKLQTS